MITQYIKPDHPYKYIIDIFNYNSLLTYAAVTKKSLKIYTRTRQYIGPYKAIDRPNPPLTIKNFYISGGLIYSRSGYNTITISYDDITKIELQEV